MKKVSLLMLVAMFLFMGNVKAQDVFVLLEDDFSAYTVGNKLASESNAAGHDWWTTWSSAPGSAEDGIIAEYQGNKCAYLESGNDQVLRLAGSQSGVYDLEFDILVPEGKSGYFNILHKFAGANSKWAMQAYLHITSDGGNTDYYNPGHGTVHAGSNGTADVACVFDQWMHFRLHVDTDADKAQYYYTVEGGEEVMVCEWQWSLDSFGDAVVDRVLDAMNFFPPMAESAYYLDNFKCTRIGGETAPELVFNPGEINEEVAADDMSSVTISIENEGTSIGEYSAWVDYGVGQGGSNQEVISYALDPVENPSGLTWQSEAPVNFEVAALFPATAYGNSVMGTYITGAAYAFFEWVDQQGNPSPGLEAGTDVIFRIYGPGTNGKPGEVLAEKVLPQNQIVWNQYTMVEFDEPVALTGFDVYVAVEMTAAVNGTTMSLDSGQAVDGFGDLYRQGKGAYLSITENGGGQNYGNWCLFMLCEGAPVVGGYATLSKTNGSIAIDGTDEVTVNLSTIGLTPGETYEAAVKFVTNDPTQPVVEIPLSLTVKGESIAENVVEKYNVYPNPTTAQVVVEGENIDYIAVYNSVGQLVNVVKNANNTVDMSAYENGVYFFNIVDNAGQSALQRVVVAK